ncbi:MAG TPA: hypothetical protein VML54_00450 [Candidatus Limnocylindrales bacterium]|nr:hypothetical protein [Candidatus Limnocylindrales bacterium]
MGRDEHGIDHSDSLHYWTVTAILALVIAGVFAAGSGASEMKSAPAGGATKPVEGYQGGYEPAPKNENAASPGVKSSDAANPDQGGPTHRTEGRIARVRSDGAEIVLDNGMILVMPDTLTVERKDMIQGAAVKARYQERAGRKFAVELEVAR